MSLMATDMPQMASLHELLDDTTRDIQKQLKVLTNVKKDFAPVNTALKALCEREAKTPDVSAAAASLRKVRARVATVVDKVEPCASELVDRWRTWEHLSEYLGRVSEIPGETTTTLARRAKTHASCVEEMIEHLLLTNRHRLARKVAVAYGVPLQRFPALDDDKSDGGDGGDGTPVFDAERAKELGWDAAPEAIAALRRHRAASGPAPLPLIDSLRQWAAALPPAPQSRLVRLLLNGFYLMRQREDNELGDKTEVVGYITNFILPYATESPALAQNVIRLASPIEEDSTSTSIEATHAMLQSELPAPESIITAIQTGREAHLQRIAEDEAKKESGGSSKAYATTQATTLMRRLVTAGVCLNDEYKGRGPLQRKKTPNTSETTSLMRLFHPSAACTTPPLFDELTKGVLDVVAAGKKGNEATIDARIEIKRQPRLYCPVTGKPLTNTVPERQPLAFPSGCVVSREGLEQLKCTAPSGVRSETSADDPPVLWFKDPISSRKVTQSSLRKVFIM